MTEQKPHFIDHPDLSEKLLTELEAGIAILVARHHQTKQTRIPAVDWGLDTAVDP